MDGNSFVVPNVFHSTGKDGYELVTGSTQLVHGAKLLGMTVTNETGSTLFVQVHDGYAQPTNGAVPLMEFVVAASLGSVLDLSKMGPLPVAKGIVIAGSSTSSTYTAAASSMFLTAFWI